MIVKTCGDEIYITGTGDEAVRAADELERRRALPMSVKAYGPSALMRKACRALEPVTYLDGPRTGLQIWAVVGEVSTSGSCRVWRQSGRRMLQIASLRGGGGDAARQAETMFVQARDALAANGLSWRNTLRTWIYLARILDWYGDFNRIRREHFDRAGLGPATGFPASTGIQGRSGGDEECQMDLLAVENLPVRFIRRTPRQNEALAYGSAFSRGAVLERNGRRVVHVSGTASIDARGRTIYRDDPVAQTRETLRNVETLLAEEGGGLGNIVSSTFFFRNPDVLDLGLGAAQPLPFPFVPVVADVCRPDLLVELEAVAVIEETPPTT